MPPWSQRGDPSLNASLSPKGEISPWMSPWMQRARSVLKCLLDPFFNASLNSKRSKNALLNPKGVIRPWMPPCCQLETESALYLSRNLWCTHPLECYHSIATTQSHLYTRSRRKDPQRLLYKLVSELFLFHSYAIVMQGFPLESAFDLSRLLIWVGFLTNPSPEVFVVNLKLSRLCIWVGIFDIPIP